MQLDEKTVQIVFTTTGVPRNALQLKTTFTNYFVLAIDTNIGS